MKPLEEKQQECCDFCKETESTACNFVEQNGWEYCKCHKPEAQVEGWEKEFDAQYPFFGLRDTGEPDLTIAGAHKNSLRSFISSLLESQRKEVLQMVEDMKHPTIEHDEGMPNTEFTTSRGSGESLYQYGYNTALSDVQKKMMDKND